MRRAGGQASAGPSTLAEPTGFEPDRREASREHEDRIRRRAMILPAHRAFRSVAVSLMIAVAGIVPATSGGPDVRAADGVPLPVLVKALSGKACVEPLPIIRRDHMKFLMHQRDETVHRGIRGDRHSLVGCIDCHAAKDDAGQWMRIDAPGQFCESCHTYASVKIDCFGCHAALPTMAFGQEAK